MSEQEYSIREKAIVDKLNKVNNVLASKKIKVNYSVYNYNGIASKLEKSDLYGADVSNAIFVRNHVCDAKYMVDSVVNSCKLTGNIEIEESFNTKVSDIENASIDELVEYFGNMDNHESIGLGKNKQYQILYKGIDSKGQNIEIKAVYGKSNKYNVRRSATKIGKDGSIQKIYSDKALKYDENNYKFFENILTEGVEYRTPESYEVVEKETDYDGKNRFKLNCLGNGNTNFQLISSDYKFKKLDSVNYVGKTTNYFEYNGKIEKASGKLACRIDATNSSVVKPNFSEVKNIADASKICDEYYKKYKSSPIVKIDEKSNKIIIEGKNTDLYKLNFNKVEESVKENFEYYLNKGFVIETINKNPVKKYVRKK